MIPPQDNGLVQRDSSLKPFQWWQTIMDAPVAVLRCPKKPVHIGLNCVVESQGFSKEARKPPEKPHEHAIEHGSELNIFRKCGKYWRITYKGHQLAVRDKVGFMYISLLLQSPYKPILALDLSLLANRDSSSVGKKRKGTIDQEQAFPTNQKPSGMYSSNDIIDQKAKDAYRERISELREEIAEAEENNDIGRCAKLQAEIDTLFEELKRTTGLGGKRRHFSDEHEKARISITKAIQRALKEIGDEHKPLEEYLTKCIKTGNSFCYNPDPENPIEWDV